MPERCELVLDCRFLVGDDVHELRDHIAGAVANDQVEVAVGPVMLPAATDSMSRLVTRFIDAASKAGTSVTTFTPPWTFDAGAACSRGIPTVLFGLSTDNLGAIDSTDAVSVDLLIQASVILANVIASWAPEAVVR